MKEEYFPEGREKGETESRWLCSERYLTLVQMKLGLSKASIIVSLSP
jgi:hypothetical protein